jgi:hypothetical protein
VKVYVFVLFGELFEGWQEVDHVFVDCLAELRNEVGSVDSFVGNLHDRLDEGQLNKERLAIFEVAVAEIVNQLEAEGPLAAEAGYCGCEEQQTEVEVHEVGFFGEVVFNMGDPFLQILQTKLIRRYSSVFFSRWQTIAIMIGISLALWVALDPLASLAKL